MPRRVGRRSLLVLKLFVEISSFETRQRDPVLDRRFLVRGSGVVADNDEPMAPADLRAAADALRNLLGRVDSGDLVAPAMFTARLEGLLIAVEETVRRTDAPDSS